MNVQRIERLMRKAVTTLGLNLRGLTVLTEAATGRYALTASLAALAGAKRVYTLTRDSTFGTAADALEQTLGLARQLNVSACLQPLPARDDPRIAEADIVTNLGFVRPIDVELLERLKRTAVIPLMWETWEFRPSDLDLSAARSRGIPVLGTNEGHADLQIFPYVGELAVKLLHELEIEIHRSKVVVFGSGKMAYETAELLRRSGADVVAVITAGLTALVKDLSENIFREADALVVVEHHERRELLGPNGLLTFEWLRDLNPGLAIAHVCGGVEVASLVRSGLAYWPQRVASAGTMSVATDYLGPRPLIDLHAGGLKVGEVMARHRLAGSNGLETERRTLAATALAQGFAGYHDGEESTA